jgi:hypothetical protein
LVLELISLLRLLSILDINIGKQLFKEVGNALEDVYVLDGVEYFHPFDKNQNDFVVFGVLHLLTNLLDQLVQVKVRVPREVI